jgi:hypothetical protein
MEELKNIADWLTTGITYSQNQESERKSELQTDYQDPNRNTDINQKTVHTSGRVKL